MAVQKADGIVTIGTKSFKVIEANVNNEILGKLLSMAKAEGAFDRYSKREDAIKHGVDMVYEQLGNLKDTDADSYIEKMLACFDKIDSLTEKSEENAKTTTGIVDGVYEGADYIIEKLLGKEALTASTAMNLSQKNDIINDILTNSKYVGKAVRKANVSK